MKHAASTLIGLAEVAYTERHFDEAVTFARRAVTLREENGATALELADARYALAAPLWELGTHRDQALALARQARDAFRDAKVAGALQKAQRWLDAHERLE